MSISSSFQLSVLNPRNSTVLVTGATGYIGSVVAERLLARGYRVRGLVRSEKSAQKAALRGVMPWLGDLTDVDSIAKAVEGVDAVIHTATLGGPEPGMSFEEAVAAAVETLELLRSLTAKQGIRLISTSGTSLYGDTGEQLVNEASPTQVPPFLQPLADIENQLTQEPHVHILRTSMVYGRAGGSGVLATIRGVKARGRAAFVNDHSELSFVHVDDLADLYVSLLQKSDAPSLVIAVSQIIDAKDLMSAAVAVVGAEEEFDQLTLEEAVSSFGDIGFYFARNMRVSSALAIRALAWEPTRAPLLKDLRAGSYRYAGF